MLIRYEAESEHYYNTEGEERHSANCGYGIYYEGKYVPFFVNNDYSIKTLRGKRDLELIRLKELCIEYGSLCECYRELIDYRVEVVLIEKEIIILCDNRKMSDSYYLCSLNVCVKSRRTNREYERSFGSRDTIKPIEGLREEVIDLIKTASFDGKIKKLQTGFYDVVMDSEATGLFVHELVGHMFEADNDMIDAKMVKAQEKISIPQVTVVDDPTLTGGFGTYLFDAEGTISSPTILIKDGRMNSLLHSKTTAQLFGEKSTANARAIDYTRLPLVRMSNTYMLPNEANTPMDLIGSTGYGIYVKGSRGSNSGVNPMVRFREMYLIKDGEIKERVANMNIIGTPISILGKIQMVANDFNIYGGGNGGCIKNGEGPLNVSAGGPHVKLHNVMLLSLFSDS